MKGHYIDTELEHSLKDLDSDFVWKKQQKQELKNDILYDIEKLEIRGIKKSIFQFSRNKKGSFIRKLSYSIVALTILFGLFIGSAFVSPSMAKVISNLPFISIDNHMIQLQKHPNKVGAYLDLVSSYNKGDLETYLQTFSKDMPADLRKQLEKDFKTREIEKHQFWASLDLIYSNEQTAILLSNEGHSFDSEVLYHLDSYVILNMEKGEWKVLDKIPFKKEGLPKYGSGDDFDKTNEVIRQIEEVYGIKVEK